MAAFDIAAFLGVMTVAYGMAHLLARRVPFFARLVAEKRRERGFEPRLEGLRGLLAACVFIHHASIMRTFLRTGAWEAPPERLFAWAGPAPVTIFFFLTGYLFCAKAIRGDGAFDVGRFYAARLRRLLPAYYLGVVAMLVVVAAQSRLTLTVSAPALAAEVSHWLALGLPFGFEMIINGVVVGPIYGVVWSLRYEVVYYLVYPALRRAMRGTRVLALIAATWIGVALAARAAASRWDGAMLVRIDFVLVTVVNFSLGWLAALLAHRIGRGRERRRVPAVEVLACALLALAIFGYVPDSFLRNSLLVFAPFLTVLLGEGRFRLLQTDAALVLGTVSYGVYLLHPIVLYVLSHACAGPLRLAEISGGGYWLFQAGVAVAVVLASAASYRFVEHPFLRKPALRPDAMQGSAVPPVPAARTSRA